MERIKLERYLNNTCTPAEKIEIQTWLAEEENKEEVMQWVSQLWEEFSPQKEELLKHLLADKPSSYSQIKSGLSKPGNRVIKKSIWFYAAAACIGFLITGTCLILHKNWSIASNEQTTVTTAMGERKRVILSDGSEIYLNAGSKLTYPSKMKVENAAIFIEGEAFFNMKESKQTRIINAAGIEASAGTGASKINISAFPKDSTVTVAVESGKAEIRNTKQKNSEQLLVNSPDSTGKGIGKPLPKTLPMMLLKPAIRIKGNEMAVIHKQEKNVDLQSGWNERKVSGWKDGIIYFDHANSNEIASTLERWYGIKIDFCQNNLPMPQYSAEFNNQQLSQVLAQLSSTLHLNYRVDGQKVYLCNQ